MASKFLQLALLLSLSFLLLAQKPCSSNQYSSSDGSCLACPSTCASCSTSETCTACLSGYFLVTNFFKAACQTCSQIFVGCSTCIANVACSSCISGYFISNGACLLCSSRLDSCNTCSSDGSTCTQCSYPYLLVNNQCISQVVSSISGGGAGGSSSSANSSGTNVTLITLGNGTKVPVVLDANGCNQLQIFYQNRCIKKISNCKIYQPNGLCQFCDNNFLVTIYGDCAPSNRILACEPGYWHNYQNDSCVKVSVACDWYYPNNGSCLNCSKGYAWVNNSCSQNVTCNSRQFFYAGTCVDVPPSCTTFSQQNGICKSCATGYALKGGICIITQAAILYRNGCKFPCLTCFLSDPGYCYSCEINYQLANARYGSCIAVTN